MTRPHRTVRLLISAVVVVALASGCTGAADKPRAVAPSKSPAAAPSARPSPKSATICWGKIPIVAVEDVSGLSLTLLVDDRSCVFRDSKGENTLSINRDPYVTAQVDRNTRDYVAGLVPRPGHEIVRPPGPANGVIDFDPSGRSAQAASFPRQGGYCSINYHVGPTNASQAGLPLTKQEVGRAAVLIALALDLCEHQPPPKL